jgi:HAD superfamily hydrolase (TIGR01548 family)
MPGEVLVFDMDGVLVDVNESYRETIRETVRYFTGREVSHEHIQDLKNAGGWNNDWALSQKIVRDFGVEVGYDTVVAYFQSILLGEAGFLSRERWVPLPGLLEALGRRFRLAIFTGRLREEARLTLDRFARDVVFDPVIGTDDIDNGKPAPDGLFKIAALVNGARLRYVGDTVDDARCARAAGVPFIGIAAPSNPRRAELARLLRAEGAVAVLEDVNQVEEAL